MESLTQTPTKNEFIYKYLCSMPWNSYYCTQDSNQIIKCKICSGSFDKQPYEFGIKYYGYYSSNFGSICRGCYKYVRNPGKCKKCDAEFSGSNLLFKHLKENNHFV